MEVERYAEKYKSDIAWLIQCFQNESLKEYGVEIDSTVLLNEIDKLRDQFFLLIIDGKCEGMIAGKEVKTPLNPIPIWYEVIWYVSEKYRKYGVRLLKHARKILKEEGYKQMVMVCMHNSKALKLFKLYNKMGYKTMEHHFIGEL